MFSSNNWKSRASECFEKASDHIGRTWTSLLNVSVTAQGWTSCKFAEKLKADQEKAKEQLAGEIATKASTSDVAAASSGSDEQSCRGSAGRRNKNW
jgi:hypothetical protein